MPIAPAQLPDVAARATTDWRQAGDWWPRRTTSVLDIAAIAGQRTEVVETGALIGAQILALLTGRYAGYPAVARLSGERWLFFAAPAPPGVTMPDLAGTDATHVPPGTPVLLPPSDGRVWRSPWKQRLAGQVMRLDVLLTLTLAAHGKLVEAGG